MTMLTRLFKNLDENSSCTRCAAQLTHVQQGIQWTQCKHRYCSECVSTLLHQQLSLFNKIPTCIYPECDQPLNMDHIPTSVISKKYLINAECDLSNIKHLIIGYIRIIHIVIPNDVLLLISDFYHLDIMKSITCPHCKDFLRIPVSSSSETMPYIPHMTMRQARSLCVGDRIDHRDNTGRFRHAVIVAKYGSSLKLRYNPDSGHPLYMLSETWSDYRFQNELERIATYDSITRRACHRIIFKFNELPKEYKVRINPTQTALGWRHGQIEKCDKDCAQVQVFYRNEYGTEDTHWTHLDNASEIKCYKNQPIHCSKCDGQKYLWVLDLQKLCRKQLRCMQCNEFYPVDSIMYWFNCCHTICAHCVLPFVKHYITTNQQIPICPANDCDEEMGEHNAYFLYDLWSQMPLEYGDVILSTYRSKGRLQTLFYHKNKFECAYCNLWHCDYMLCNDKSVDCDHKYSKVCREEWVASNGDTGCIKCVAKCEICQKYSANGNLRKWAVCGHKYHIDCAQEYISEWIPPNASNSIFDVWTKKECMIPLCIHKDCKQLLDVPHALYFSLTHHQNRALCHLRNESILVDNNQDFMHLNYPHHLRDINDTDHHKNSFPDSSEWRQLDTS